MKQNKIFRLSAILLVLTLLSTCVISGTFAKYTTSGSATDTARVAKWGVTVTATGNEAFDKEYSNGSIISVQSSTTDNVIAPGTTGDLCSLKITGTPEVAVSVAATADLTLTGWKVGSVEYCPLEFTVTAGGTATPYKIDGTYDTIAKLEAAVEKAIVDVIAKASVNPKTDLANLVSVTWAWAFEGEDENDTALGNLATAPTISISVSVTVTQID